MAFLDHACSAWWNVTTYWTADNKGMQIVYVLSMHGSIFKLVRVTVCAADYDDHSLHTSVIRQNYVFLLETLDVKCSDLLSRLFSTDVLSPVEKDDIAAEQTSFRANEKLLSALSRKSPQQFQLFLDALDDCGQQHVRNVITDRPGLVFCNPEYFFTITRPVTKCQRMNGVALRGKINGLQEMKSLAVDL